MDSRLPLLAAFAAFSIAPALVSPALAEPRDDVRAGSARCDGIADDRAWLDCYYGAAQPMRAKLGLAPAPSSQQILVPPARPGAISPSAPAMTAPSVAARSAAPAPRGNFFQRLLSHAPVKDEQPTRMAAYKFDSRGYFTVTLANGEVWKQSESDTSEAKWRNRPQTYVVKIMAGQKMSVGGHEMYDVEQVR